MDSDRSVNSSTLCETGQWRALGLLAILAVAAILWIAIPVGIGLLLGTLTAFVLRPYYERMGITRRHPGLAALLCVLMATTGLAGIMGGLGYLLVVRGIAVAYALMGALAPGGPARHLIDRLAGYLSPLHLTSVDLAARLRDAAADLASRAARLVATLADLAFGGLLALFFIVLSMFYILRHWTEIVRRIEVLLPLHPRHTRALLDEFRRGGRSVLLGAVITGVAQGLLAGIGYWVAGMPEAAFLGAATAVASLIPGVGTLLVWVPAGAFLIASGHFTRGLIELIYGGAVVVGVSDYVLRPMLVGTHGNTPAILTFIALFGGIKIFGLIGLILGPVIMVLAVALLRIYEQEAIRRRDSLLASG